MNWIDPVLTLITLIGLELILGIDNLIFLSIATEKLPPAHRHRARHWGLMFAWITRLLFLFFAFNLVKLNSALFILRGTEFSIHSLVMLLGGGFLIIKSVQEIHLEMTPREVIPSARSGSKSFWAVVLQIGIMDLVFSIDSVMTAIGLTRAFWIMATSITAAILLMIYLSTGIANFIRAFPTFKMLALCFLFLIGTILIAEGFSFQIPREYVYVVLIFSLFIESLNILKSKRNRKVSKNNQR